MAGLVPEGHRLQEEENAARNWQNAANLVLQGAQLGLDLFKTVEAIKTQSFIRDKKNFDNTAKSIMAQKIEAGIQPFAEKDGEMRYEQYPELTELGNQYVESVRQKYGEQAAKDAQAHVDGMNIDAYFNAAKLLNRDAVELTETNGGLMAEKAVEAGDFRVYENWLGTVEDAYMRSQLYQKGKKEFDYGMALKSAEGVYDAGGLDAATLAAENARGPEGTEFSVKEKEALKADIGKYAAQQTREAGNAAASAFESAMKSTGGNIGASVTAAEKAAEKVTGSPEARRAAEQKLSGMQSEALNESFNEFLIDNGANAEQLESQADLLRKMGDGGDYRGQTNLRRNHIEELERRAASIRAAEDAAIRRAGSEASKEIKEEAKVDADALIDRYMRWERGEQVDGRTLLRDLVDFGSILGEKQNAYIENLVFGKDKSYSEDKYRALGSVLKAAKVDPQRQAEILESLRQARLDGADGEQMGRLIDGFNRVETAKYLSGIMSGKELRDTDAVAMVEAANAGDLDAYIYSRSDTKGGSKENWIGGESMKKAYASLKGKLEGVAAEAGLDIKNVEMAKDAAGDSDGYYIATDNKEDKYRLGVTKGGPFNMFKKLGLERLENGEWVPYKYTVESPLGKAREFDPHYQ
ncbi:MAG: hypothetical protein LBG27_00470 [Spirochaetaceae bacterium]|jgi:hypothetical protein|nr:hypothetical protein [Spirochaetaceae bacterium]